MSLKLEGTVKGPWVDELQKAWSASAETSPTMSVRVDLAGVSFVDPRGLDLLLRMQAAGATLERTSPFLRQVLGGNETKAESPKK